ncbi:MAG: diguanylate cyclase domain-containing protein [Thainema sp.]
MIELLYEGSKVIVYRAHDTETQETVVLKTLRSHHPSLHDVAKLKHQYEILVRLNAPGVIRVYRLDEYQRRHWLVLEDFCGQPLDQLIAQCQENIAFFLNLAYPLAQSVGEIHRAGIIHRDLKPQNILFDPSSGQVKLIDFELSLPFDQEIPAAQAIDQLEGTPLYMAPEQTGRMNRAIDYRCDFYTLGATFYHLLTGQPPFKAQDPMELVHCHIAKLPLPPMVLNAKVPAVLSDIVLKLLAKMAEDRYQSATGLAADLEHCRQMMVEQSAIASFPLAQHDQCDRFEIPQKLYGRETEVQTLLHAFERVSAGAIELMLVSGFSGIGKTALIHEIHKPIVRQRGYFISGKFDQLQRSVPYASLIQAFRGLIRQLLAESDSQIAHWQTKLQDALGANRKVMADVIPEVECIIGASPDVPTLGPTEARNRFNQVFQQFVEVFAQPEHPLVIFLDDLQWADSASLQLMQNLLTSRQGSHLLLIGAYRDSEVSAAHPLMTTLEELEQAWVRITELRLSPLSLEDIQRLVAETVQHSESAVYNLAHLLQTKTHGNPFFIKQLLTYLHDERHITFYWPTGQWQWSLPEIEQVPITDNVVDLMITRLERLAKSTQQLLQLAACIGNQFDLLTLAVVAEQPPLAIAQVLIHAIQQKFIVTQGNAHQLLVALDTHEAVQFLQRGDFELAYRFVHDRVHQAAYELIPEGDQQAVHLKIGRLLQRNLAQTAFAQATDDRIFERVNQFNQALPLLVSPAERLQVAELNLIAGQKAKAAVAYEVAVRYLRLGRQLLPTDSWATQYKLTFDLYRAGLECEYLGGNFEQSEELFHVLMLRSQSVIEKAEIYSLQLVLYTSLGKFAEVIALGKDGLALLGWQVPPTPAAVKRAVKLTAADIRLRLLLTRIPDLVDLPVLTDPLKLAQLNLMAQVIPALYYTDINLSNLFYLQMSLLSLKHGNAPASAVAYLGLGRFLGEYHRDSIARYDLGKLALALVEKFNYQPLLCKTHFLFGGFINHWTRHSRTDIHHLRMAYQAGVEHGDLNWACYANNVMGMRSFSLGLPLPQLEQMAQQHLNYAQQVKEQYTPCFFVTTRQLAHCLMGNTLSPCSLSDAEFDAEQHYQTLAAHPGLVGPLNWYTVTQTFIHYLHGECDRALEFARQSDATIYAAIGLVRVVEHTFYYALCLAAVYPSLEETEQKKCWSQLQDHVQQLQRWAKDCPDNYDHKWRLVQAEIAQLCGRSAQAQQRYEQAIESAHQHGFIHYEALANERLAHHYTQRGNQVIARAYLAEARYAYLQWGAIAKVKALETEYPYLVTGGSTYQAISERSTAQQGLGSSTIERKANRLDLYSVIKASHAITREIQLEQLVKTLMQVIIENAGAQRGCLLLPEGEQWIIKACGSTGEATIPAAQIGTIPLREQVPQSVVNYVARTAESLLLNQPHLEDGYANDPYIQQHQPQSLLCCPLIHQGMAAGIIYLEHDTAAHVFTPERLELIQLLSAQAAIALTNARLYAQLQASENQLTQFLEAMPIAVGILDQSGNPYYANRRAVELLGKGALPSVPSADIAQAYQIYHTQQQRICEPHEMPIIQALSGQTSTTDALEIRHQQKRIPIETWAAPIFDEQGNVIYALTAFQDITERKRAEQILADYNRVLETQIAERTAALRESEALQRAMLNAIPDLLIVVRADGTYLDCLSRGHSELLSHDCSVVGRHVTDVLPAALAQQRMYHVQAALSSGQLQVYEHQILIDDQLHYEETRIVKLADNQALVIVRDISDRKSAELSLQQANKELERLASVDGLTQIANRRRFDAYLAQEWKRLQREHRPLCLILCDIDYFKLYNDYYGHPAGDACLVQVAQVLRQSLKRPADLATRYGGEEFALILPNTSAAGGITIAQTIQQALHELHLPHVYSTASHQVTLSLGIASWIPQPDQSPANLIAAADAALYQAKQQGRNQYAIADATESTN